MIGAIINIIKTMVWNYVQSRPRAPLFHIKGFKMKKKWNVPAANIAPMALWVHFQRWYGMNVAIDTTTKINKP